MKEYKEGSKIFRALYEISSCMPSPPNFATKNNKSGFCSIPMFALTVIYKDAFDLGFESKEGFDFNEMKIGRKETGDNLTNLEKARKNKRKLVFIFIFLLLES